MTQALNILKQRRIWATVFAVISLTLRAVAPDLEFDENKATEVVMTLIQTISDLGMVLLPLWSYIKPKK